MLEEAYPHLARSAGPLLPLLQDPQIREIRCTSAGRVFAIHSDEGKQQHPNLDPRVLDGFLALVADAVGGEWRESHPTLHAANPRLGFRVQASRFPVSPGPCMTLRRHPERVYPLATWVDKGILTRAQHDALEQALFAHQTIVLSGAVGSSKTSLLNALLHALRETEERIVIIEDDPEIVCEALDCEFQRTVRGLEGQATRSMEDLCIEMLRHSPDRVVVGELRGAEALTTLQAFQTGHAGLTTVHAPSAASTLLRLEQLIHIRSVDPQRALIAEAVNIIVHMEAYKRLWRCTNILRVAGELDAAGRYVISSL
jgi:type IV secretion system protein TrbB